MKSIVVSDYDETIKMPQNEPANGKASRCHLEQIFSKLQLFNQQWLEEMNVAQREELGEKAWWAQFEALPMVKLC